MLNHQNMRDYSRECIDAQKVFDYIINKQKQSFQDVTFNFPPGTDIGPVNTFDVLSCRIVPDGEVINGVTAVTECVEVTDPENRPTVTYELPSGEEVILQCVTLQKTVTIAITVERTNSAGTTFTEVAISDPIILDPEEVIMCAPTGTDIDCTITDASRCLVFNLTPNADEDTATGTAQILVCQAIQSNAIVKLEILAKLCQPRDQIKVDLCPVPESPQQCPQIFPGNNSGKDCGCY